MLDKLRNCNSTFTMAIAMRPDLTGVNCKSTISHVGSYELRELLNQSNFDH
jgi:hypothetical protein